MTTDRDSSMRPHHFWLSFVTPTLIALATLISVPPSAIADGPNPSAVHDINGFVDCLNLIKAAKGTIADAVRCVPPGCYFTVTMSERSAQKACALGGCELPRVIFNCAGSMDGLRLRPSFLLCPKGSIPRTPGAQMGMNRIEIGEDVNTMADQKMADVPIPPRTTDFTAIKADDVLNKVEGTFGTKHCNFCHGDPGTMGDLQLSTAIRPDPTLILDTNEPGITVDPDIHMSLDEVCQCIEENTDAIIQDLQTMSQPTDALLGRQILLQLCRRLANKTRGGAAPPPASGP